MKIKTLLPVLILVLFLATVIGYIYFVLSTTPIISNDIITENITTSSNKKLSEPSTTFIIGGDVMFGRAVAWKFNNNVKSAFQNLGENYFANTDLGVINLEGPINQSEFRSDPNPDNLIFKFPPESIDALEYLGVNAVSLANNHSENQGPSGLETTRQLLSNANISGIGSQSKFDESSVKEIGKLSIIAVNLVGQNVDISESIKNEKNKGQSVLVFAHWGNEYQTFHSSIQETYAHLWIDSGADIIIGSHPHVVQDAEIYKNKVIFYSIGNLIFDQNFSNETTHGLILKGEISLSKTSITLLPTTIENYQVRLSEGITKQSVIDSFKKEISNATWQNDNFEIASK